MGLHLVLGGARSGKSRHAQAAAEDAAARQGRELVFVATAEALDGEMQTRIARHKADRSAAWRLVEAPLDLPQALLSLSSEEVVLVDCLTLWLTNSLLAGDGLEAHRGRIAELTAALQARGGETWLVSNEVGQGVTPNNALARQFIDEAGWLHQAIGAIAEDVVMLVAGLPLQLKAPAVPSR